MNNTVHCCMQTNMHKDLFVRKCELTEPTPECSWLSTLRAQICSVNRQGRGHQSPQVVASIGWRQSLIRATRVTSMQKPHANAAHSCLLRVPAKLSPFGTIAGEKRNQSNSFLLKRAVITPCFCFLCDDHIPASLSDPISTRSQLGMGAKLLLFVQRPGHTGVTSRPAKRTDWQHRQNQEQWISGAANCFSHMLMGKTARILKTSWLRKSSLTFDTLQPILPGLLVWSPNPNASLPLLKFYHILKTWL